MFAHAARRTALALVALATCAPAAMGQRRTWTDGTGKFSVEAELVETKQESVVLRKANGSTITVPLARRSDADRRYLKTLVKPDGTLPGGDGPRANLAFPDALTQVPPWNAANPPFDLATFLRAPPAEENAAPLYLDAFCEFSPAEMVVLFPDMPEQERRNGTYVVVSSTKKKSGSMKRGRRTLDRSMLLPSMPGWPITTLALKSSLRRNSGQSACFRRG
jgi:SLA1 homology domain 1, SHD1